MHSYGCVFCSGYLFWSPSRKTYRNISPFGDFAGQKSTKPVRWVWSRWFMECNKFSYTTASIELFETWEDLKEHQTSPFGDPPQMKKNTHTTPSLVWRPPPPPRFGPRLQDYPGCPRPSRCWCLATGATHTWRGCFLWQVSTESGFCGSVDGRNPLRHHLKNPGVMLPL